MRIVATLTTTLLLLAACSGEPEVREPDPSPSASADAAPTMPAQAKEDSEEGRVAFAVHFIEVFNHAQRTGDVESLSALSSEACEGCTDFISLFEDTYKSGGYFRDADFEIIDLAIDSAEDPFVVFARVKTEPTKYRTTSEDPEETGNAQDEALVFELSESPERREVVRFERGL